MGEVAYACVFALHVLIAYFMSREISRKIAPNSVTFLAYIR